MTVRWLEKVSSSFPNHILQYFNHIFCVVVARLVVTGSGNIYFLNELCTFPLRRVRALGTFDLSND